MKKFKTLSILSLPLLFLTFINFDSTQNNKYINGKLKNESLEIKNNGYVKDIALGELNSAAIVTDPLGNDYLFTWGNNRDGQLGLNDTTNYDTPQLVTFFEENNNFKKLEAGWNHVGVVVENSDESDSLYLWGENDSGQLGDTNNPSSPIPQEVIFPIEGKIKDFDLGRYHSGAVLTDIDGNDHVYTWGKNNTGQLGTGFNYTYTEPTEITSFFYNMDEVTNIVLGGYHSGVTTIDKNGKQHFYLWGNNDLGQLGLDTKIEMSNKPKEVVFSNSFVKDFDLGLFHSGAIITDEHNDDYLFMWGGNSSGQLGLGEEYSSTNIPKEVTTIKEKEIKEIKLDGFNTGIVTVDSNEIEHLYIWGGNDFGQVGTGETDTKYFPKEITINLPYKFIIKNFDLGGYHSAASLKDERGNEQIYTWGHNNYGQLGNGDKPRDKYSPQELSMFERGLVGTKLTDVSEEEMIFEIAVPSIAELNPESISVHNSKREVVGEVEEINENLSSEDNYMTYTFKTKIINNDEASNNLLCWSSNQGETLNLISTQTYVFGKTVITENDENNPYLLFNIFVITLTLLIVVLFLFLILTKWNQKRIIEGTSS